MIVFSYDMMILRYDMIYDNITKLYETIRDDTIRYDMIRYDMKLYDTKFYSFPKPTCCIGLTNLMKKLWR